VAITDLVPVPALINPGVKNAKQTTMLSVFGSPRQNFSDDCQPVTNPLLRDLQVTASVGRFRVTGIKPAVDALRLVIEDITREVPPVAAALGTAGMLCARFVRGSAQSISNHAWGTAIDVTLNNLLDRRGDDRVQEGLVAIAPIFNRHGWFWGAGFGTEDAMHFEVGDDLIRRWAKDGVVDGGPAPRDKILTMGDRGPEVVALQEALNREGANLEPDGKFGPGTRAAVAAFQSAHGLVPDGVANLKTRKALGLP
jgi:hypothetical protein